MRAAIRRGAPLLGLVIAASGVLAVGGCGSDPEPPPATSAAPTPTATPTPTPTVTPMAMPSPTPEVSLQQFDEVGALAAAEYFVELFDYVYATGDLEAWDAVAGQSCDLCSSVHDDVTSIYGAGGQFRSSGSTTYRDFRLTGRDDVLGIWAVELVYVSPGGFTTTSDGSVESALEPQSGGLVIEVGESARGWYLVGGRAIAGSSR